MFTFFLKKKINYYIVHFFFIVLILYIVSPLYWYKYPILVDYQNHLASYFIQANIDNDKWLQENYRVEWHIKPYLIVDVLGGTLAKYIDIFIVGKTIILLGVLLIVIGALLIRKLVNRRIDLWMLTLLVTIFNIVLFMGLVSYYISLGLAFIMMAAWIKFRNISFLKNILLFTLVSTFLFFCHLYALGVYAIFVISYEAGLFKYSKDNFSVLSLVKALSQFLLPTLLFLVWYSGVQHDNGAFFVYAGWQQKIFNLISPICFDYSNYSKYLTLFFLVFVLVLRFIYQCKVSIYDAMKLPLISFLLISIITPTMLAGVYATDLRFPIIFMILLISSIQFDENNNVSKKFRNSVIVLSIITACLKSFIISSTWSNFNAQYQEFEGALQNIKQGSKIITIQKVTDKTAFDVNQNLYHHMPALSIIKRATFWPNLFTVNLTPIYPTPTTRKIDTPLSDQLSLDYLLNPHVKNGYVYGRGKVVYWENWKKDFDYLISTRFDDFSIIKLKELKLVVRGSFFDIYEIIH